NPPQPGRRRRHRPRLAEGDGLRLLAAKAESRKKVLGGHRSTDAATIPSFLLSAFPSISRAGGPDLRDCKGVQTTAHASLRKRGTGNAVCGFVFFDWFCQETHSPLVVGAGESRAFIPR